MQEKGDLWTRETIDAKEVEEALHAATNDEEANGNETNQTELRPKKRPTVKTRPVEEITKED